MRPATWSSVITFAVFLGHSLVVAAQPRNPVEQAVGAQPVPAPPTAPGGLKIETPSSSIKLGVLIQPGFENDNGTAASDTRVTSFFLRRARLMVAMTLGSQIEVFAETDAANLGKANGVAGNPGAVLQDAFITWKPADEFKLDFGMMLVPFSHNAIQSAASLYGLDYFAFTFQQSAGLSNFAGRDTGVQLRGLIASTLEYRLGLFQGNRAAPPMGMMAPPPPSRTAMRFMGRVQINLLDPETGYFYGGTYGGTKKILSVGGGIDHQDDYNGITGDAFLDLPIGRDVLTAQVDVLHFDGGTWIPSLPKQTNLHAEAGYRVGELRVSPIVRFEEQLIASASPAAPNVLRYSAGLAWWVMSHTMNVKAFYTYVQPDQGLRNYTQINLQMQYYVF